MLFSTTDTAVLEPLNLYFEDEYGENGGHQKVVASYEERYASGSGYPQPAVRGGGRA